MERRNEMLDGLLELARKDLKKIGKQLEKDESNKTLIAEYGFRLGVVEGLERASYLFI
ncbi:hypothetical protein C7437_1011002 [Psychrobacillus insolitus]|uniref:Uncharacterized protein n=1 Tax=Psychrobacillus insolitus TaxID=1461 RepID=A0A2W7MM84_9BACI|nr:hypothetical protein [Psychrobacillus insolitus]PZX07880.1 hypothetical protein C7437_1011002 [Psychrobacillus insolitus]